MPLRNVGALFEPRSIAIIAESFAPGTHGALALQALSSAKPSVPVVMEHKRGAARTAAARNG